MVSNPSILNIGEKAIDYRCHRGNYQEVAVTGGGVCQMREQRSISDCRAINVPRCKRKPCSKSSKSLLITSCKECQRVKYQFSAFAYEN